MRRLGEVDRITGEQRLHTSKTCFIAPSDFTCKTDWKIKLLRILRQWPQSIKPQAGSLWPWGPVMVSFIYVHLTGSLGAQLFGQTLFWALAWERFRMKLTFKSVDGVKQIALSNVSRLYPIGWSLNITKRLTLLWVKEDASCITASKMGHELFPAFRLCLGLQPAGLGTGTTLVALPGPQLASSPCTFGDLPSIKAWANDVY